MNTLSIDRSPGATGCAVAASLALAGAIAWQPELLPIGILVALLGAVALLNPIIPLSLALLLAPLNISFLLGQNGTATNTVSVLIFLLISGAILRIALLGQLQVRPLMVLSGLVGVAVYVLTVPTVAVELESGLTFAAQLLTPIAAYLVARDADFGLPDERVVSVGRRAVISSIGLAFALTAVILLLGRTAETLSGENVSRFTGSLGSGSFAFFLLPPLIVSMAAVSVKSTRGRWICLGLLTTALLATLTRSALLAAVIAVVYFSVLAGTQGRGSIILMLCVALSGIFVATSPEALNRFRPDGAVSGNLVRGTLSGREDLWSFIWNTSVAPSPLVGSGLGATAPIFAHETSFRTGSGAVHNDYLDIWAQAGLLALVGYALFLLSVLGNGVKAVLNARTQPPRDEWSVVLTRAVPPLILAFIVIGMFDNAAANFVHIGVPVFIVAGFTCRRQRATDPMRRASQGAISTPSSALSS